MLELKGIVKEFPGVKALDNVSLTFKEGETHALLGENGAGKSTLIKIICGIYKADKGKMFLNGKELNFRNYRDAIDNEISIVQQEIQVIPESSIGENIMLDKLNWYSKSGKINWNAINEDSKKYLEMVGLNIDPRDKIGPLSAAHKQLIQIAKALASNAKVLLLDEPTSSLTNHEASKLFEIVNKLKNEGVALIFVSHKLEEVLEICDKVSVLRDGKYIGTEDCKNLSKQQIIKMMIGRETKDIYMGKLDVDKSKKVLEVKNLYQEGTFANLNFELYKGEILGFYGLVGSGRTELAKILIGEDKKYSGEIFINGEKAKISSMADSLYKYKLGYVSENRKEEGLILSSTVKTNIGITIWKLIVNKFLKMVSLTKEKDEAQKMVDALKIKVTGVHDEVGKLSGGNQQKVSLAKWLSAGCDILIIDEPTVGVDIGAKEAIHQIIWDLAKIEGKSIILISSDMPELCKLSRRTLVFKNFCVSGTCEGINDREYSYDELSTMIGTHLA
ncbi:sugar ABC transporter ATP-binding protein [Clostridium thailandense]|uniref:sugar ABC transporter ATP-binding protein n=1 Tax=Clostridium thailandense TaxID=2794346 RepID=UPI00398A09C8